MLKYDYWRKSHVKIVKNGLKMLKILKTGKGELKSEVQDKAAKGFRC